MPTRQIFEQYIWRICYSVVRMLNVMHAVVDYLCVLFCYKYGSMRSSLCVFEYRGLECSGVCVHVRVCLYVFSGARYCSYRPGVSRKAIL